MLAIFDLFAFMIFVLIVTGIVTQIVLPGLRGRQLFPWFRKEHDLMQQRFETQQGIHERRIQKSNNDLINEERNVQHEDRSTDRGGTPRPADRRCYPESGGESVGE